MKDDGGPASDKTMRQYYKAAALQRFSINLSASALAEFAGEVADAMIAEDRAHAEGRIDGEDDD